MHCFGVILLGLGDCIPLMKKSDDQKQEEPELELTSRRDVLKMAAAGLLSASPVASLLGAFTGPPAQAAQSHETHSKIAPRTYLFFTKIEALFIEAATARLIPADEKWGGAFEANVSNYIDKQLAGSWGAGERLYRSGPWQAGTPQQGYQLAFTPAEFYRTALKALDKELSAKGTSFHEMKGDQQDEFLHDLETSTRDLGGVPAKEFFASLLKSTNEGFFSDPVYGGNKDMISWKMIGFPGASASYYELVDQHGIKLNRKPVSLAEDVSGHMHMNPNIPAKIPAK